MREFLNSFDKDTIYRQYISLIEEAKDYEKITRYKMVEVGQKTIVEDFTLVAKALTYERFNDVRDTILKFEKNGLIVFEPKFMRKFDPMMLYFMSKTIDVDGFVHFVLDTDIINHFKNFSWTDELYEYKLFETVAFGMVETYGDMAYSEIDELYHEIREDKYQKYPSISMNFQMKINMFSKGHLAMKDGVIHRIIDQFDLPLWDVEERKLFDLEYFYNKGKYLLKIDDMSEAKHITKDEIGRIIGNAIQEEIQIQDDPVSFLKSPEFYNGSQVSDFKETIYDWPLWQYGGLSFSEIEGKQDGVIDRSLGEGMLEFITRFVEYGNHKYRYTKHVETELEAYHVLTKTLKRKNIFEGFKRSRFYPHSEFSDIFLKSFEEAVMIKQGLAIDYFGNKLIVVHDNVIYHVSGITHSIETNISSSSLPQFVDFVLLPLDNALTYGLSIVSYPVFAFRDKLQQIQTQMDTADQVHDLNDLLMLKHMHTSRFKN